MPTNDPIKQKKWSRAHYLKHKADYKKRNIIRHARLRDIIGQMKNVPCTDCGKKYPHYVMEFDHVRGRKKFAISAGIIRYAWKDILKEIKKCEVVCSNCHQIRTYKRNRE